MPGYTRVPGDVFKNVSFSPETAASARIEDEFDSLGGRLIELNDRIRYLETRICGSRPEAITEKPSPAASPNGMLSTLRELASNYSRQLNDSRERIERMIEALG